MFQGTFLATIRNANDVIYEQRERVFHRDIQTRERPGETRARVVYMASQMNRDVTECFRLLI
jgi:hypothetical protein